MDWEKDYIQFINPVSSLAANALTYFDEAAALDVFGNKNLAGWYDRGGEVSYNTMPIPAGYAFLGNFISPNVKLVFPSPLAP